MHVEDFKAIRIKFTSKMAFVVSRIPVTAVDITVVNPPPTPPHIPCACFAFLCNLLYSHRILDLSLNCYNYFDLLRNEKNYNVAISISPINQSINQAINQSLFVLTLATKNYNVQ